MTVLDETQVAIDRSFAGLTPYEYRVLRGAVFDAAITMESFSANDVWDFVRPGSEPRNKVAIGAVLQRMKREGFIRKTGKTVPSVRTHASPISVWELI